MRNVEELLTQRADVRARVQTWTATDEEGFGADALLYSDILCLLVPVAVSSYPQLGLNIAQQPARVYFEPDKFITKDSAEQPYSNVQVVVNDETWYIVGPQARPFRDLGMDDEDHVQVIVVRQEVH